jgi:hypothetical protein
VVYWPALVIFIVARLLLNLYSSMLSDVSKYNLGLPTISRKSIANSFCKVYWLLVSTIWGTMHLFTTRESSNGGESDQAFGQILPVIMLAAPLTIAEYLYSGKLNSVSS